MLPRLSRRLSHAMLLCAAASCAIAARATAQDGRWLPLLQRPWYGAAAITDPVRHRLLLFGGHDLTSLRNEVWAFPLTGTDRHWTLVATTGTPPPPRMNANAVYDPVRDRMIVVGGQQQYTMACDVWALTLSGTPEWSEVVPAGPAPGPRYAPSLVYDSARDRLVMFGGYLSGYYDEVWALPLSGTPAWTQVVPESPGPSGRWEHGAIYDPARDRMVMFGGVGSWTAPPPVETWALSFGDVPQWSVIATGGPGPRVYGSALYDAPRDRMLFLGGGMLDGTLTNSDEVWELPLGGSDWNRLDAARLPTPLWNPLAALDPDSGALGVVGQQPLDDVWSLDLGTLAGWNREIPSESPPGVRSGHSVVLDAAGSRVLLYGGHGQWLSRIHPLAPVYGDVVALGLDGKWSAVPVTGTPPAPRWAHTAVLDPVLERMVVFGGLTGSTDAGTPTAGLFSLSLAGDPAWAALEIPGPAPAARSGHTAVIDPARRRMVIYGGTDGSATLGDVWALPLSADSAWIPLSPEGAAPAPRADHAAIFDPAHDRMLVYGGDGGDGGELWALEFSPVLRWTQIVRPGSPGPRWRHRAALDPLRQRMLVFGGSPFPEAIWPDAGLWALSLDGDPAWTPLSLVGDPSPGREYPGLVFDPAGDRLLVLQGRYRCLGPDCIRPWLAMSDAWQLSFDRATPALISLAAVEAGVDGVRLAWLAGGERLASYELERRDAESGWRAIAGLGPDGRGRLEYLDRDVVPGATYRYRLALGGGVYAGETEVRVPATPALALFGVSPNPASARAVARFALPAGGAASLDVLDLTGRRAASRDFAQLSAGSHEVALPEIATLPPGLYFLRLTYRGEARIRRFSVTR